MYNEKTILAFIGARAGSKGLKGKNILNFAGRPMVYWSIKAGLNSKFIDRVIVSTDSQKIANFAKRSGGDVPFLRPKAISQDKSTLEDAVRHCIDFLKKQKMIYDYVTLLQPTSPLRTTKHIDNAIEFYFKNKRHDSDRLVGVTIAPKKMGWLMRKNKVNYVEFCFNVKKNKNHRQDIPEYYLPNGAIYIISTKEIMRSGLYDGPVLPFLMKEEDSIDIDTKKDFNEALKIFKKSK